MEGDIKGFFLVGMGLNLLTYFFQMIVLFFANLLWRNAIKFKRC